MTHEAHSRKISKSTAQQHSTQHLTCPKTKSVNMAKMTSSFPSAKQFWNELCRFHYSAQARKDLQNSLNYGMHVFISNLRSRNQPLLRDVPRKMGQKIGEGT
eukprot:6212069-Pleurochrysis_carterae.AAC.1